LKAARISAACQLARAQRPALSDQEDSMINVIVTLQIKAGMEATAEELLRQLETETTENDAGCLRYQWYRSEQPGMYVLLERWASQAAVDAHFQAEHMTKLLPQITDCAVEPFKAIRLTRLE
jgi:quinol monooxygenase YgiN